MIGNSIPFGSKNPQAIMDQAQADINRMPGMQPGGAQPPMPPQGGVGTQPGMPQAPVNGMPPGMPPGGMMPPQGLGAQTPFGMVNPTAGMNPQVPPQNHLSEGGIPDSNEMAPWFVRKAANETVHNSGLTKSLVPGRTDQLNHQVPAGAYVIPADVVSGMGEGNTLAGANIMQHIFSGPKGMPMPDSRGSMGPPRAPSAYREPGPNESYAKGGATSNSHVPVVLAGGEYVVHPDDVKRISGAKGDLKRGHGILDKFVVHARKQIAKQMLKLPGPQKD